MALEIQLVDEAAYIRALNLLISAFHLLEAFGVRMVLLGARALPEAACIGDAPRLIIPLHSKQVYNELR